MVLVSYPIALVLLAVAGGDRRRGHHQRAVFWGALCGVSQAFGVWWFYAALGSGPISVVSPLTAILVAGIPVGVGLAMGERPGSSRASASCWRWSRSCWSAARRPTRTSRRTSSPPKWPG